MEYRLILLTTNNLIDHSQVLNCTCDEDAMTMAAKLGMAAHAIALWQGTRIVLDLTYAQVLAQAAMAAVSAAADRLPLVGRADRHAISGSLQEHRMVDS